MEYSLKQVKFSYGLTSEFSFEDDMMESSSSSAVYPTEFPRKSFLAKKTWEWEELFLAENN